MNVPDKDPPDRIPDGKHAFRLHGTLSPRKAMILIVQPQGRLNVTAPNELAACRMLAFAADLVAQGYEDCTWWKRQPEWLRTEWERLRVEPL